MTYNAKAVSDEGMLECSLYEFRHGTDYYRYTNADRDIVYDGETYTAASITDSGVQQDGSSDGSDLTISIDSSLPVPELFRGTPPSETVKLRVRRKCFDDEDAPVYWYGRVGAMRRIDEVTSELSGILGTLLGRGGLRLCWTRSCPHVLYGPGCKLNKDDYAVPATVTDVAAGSFDAVEIGGEDATWFDGGFVEWQQGGAVERRMIVSTDGDKATLLDSSDGLEVDLEIVIYPGCDLLISTCDAKFSNRSNNGGVPNMAGRSWVDGSPVY